MSTTTTTPPRRFTVDELTAATPAQIDEVLADLYAREQHTRQESVFAIDQVMEAAGMRFASDRSTWRANRTVGTVGEALTVLESRNDYAATRALQRYQRNQEALAAIKAMQHPLTEEYDRRGGWTRAFLVFASNGHVHSSMYCSTCFPTTRYGWLTELSGQDEDTIVAAIGADACTVCYPSAPVEKGLPRTVLHASEKAAAQERAEREAAKAARAAAKAAKAITTPEGEPLQVFDWHVPQRIVRVRDGERVIPAEDRYETLTTLHAAKSWLTDAFDGREKRGNDVRLVAASIAAKLGTTAEVELEAARRRANKRR